MDWNRRSDMHTKKNIFRPTFDDLGAPSVITLLSPAVREVMKNVELVRLPLVGLKSRNRVSYKSDNQLRQELWPGVGVGGAAIQCIHCREAGRQVIHSLAYMWQHLGRLAYYHFSQCKKIPTKKMQRLQDLIPRVSATNFQSFQTELGLLCQHVSKSLQHNHISIPLVQTHQNNHPRGRSKFRGNSRGEGLRVYDLNKLEYYVRPNNKLYVASKRISYDQKLDYHTTMRQGNAISVIKTNGATQVLQGETCRRKRKFTEKGSPVEKGPSLVMHLEEISHDKNESGHTSFAYKKINKTENL